MILLLLTRRFAREIKGMSYGGEYKIPFFPFRDDPFSEGRQSDFDRIVSHEPVSIPLNFVNFSPCISIVIYSRLSLPQTSTDQNFWFDIIVI